MTFGLKPMSKIDEIMTRFALVGPRAQAKPIKAAAEAADEEDEEGKDQGDLPPIDDEAEEGEVSPKEFEYLLGMPMWSVTEERVNQLIRLMDTKKIEHDNLSARTIYELWTEDLDAFQKELADEWAREEIDRQ